MKRRPFGYVISMSTSSGHPDPIDLPGEATAEEGIVPADAADRLDESPEEQVNRAQVPEDGGVRIDEPRTSQ
jgi:hypothetical protein